MPGWAIIIFSLLGALLSALGTYQWSKPPPPAAPAAVSTSTPTPAPG